MMVQNIGKTIKVLFFLLMVFLGGCKSKLSLEQSQKLFLKAPIESRDFRKGLEGLAENLYAKQWPQKYDFRRPKIKSEQMIIEWEHRTKKKTIRKRSVSRCYDNIERLALSCLIAQTGPVSVDRLMQSEEFKDFVLQLREYLTQTEMNESLLQKLQFTKAKILKRFAITESQAAANEISYKTGLIVTTGFYLGFPIYKSITLDKDIETREEFLQVYLHECGHQLFDQYRRLRKTLKLGLSWIGWTSSIDSWWIIEEKSNNIFAEFILKNLPRDFKEDKRMHEQLQVKPWVLYPLHESFKERYSLLFFHSTSVLENLKNSRINNRYTTQDRLSEVIRSKLQEQGVEGYIRSINGFYTLEEVLRYWQAEQLLEQ